MVKQSFKPIHLIADCCDCDWRTEDYKNGKILSAKHARDFKHKVIVEIGESRSFDGRPKDYENRETNIT